MGKRGYHDFSFKISCHTVPKNFVGEEFGVPENFGYRKSFFCMRRGYHDFLSKIFCLTVPKKFVKGSFCVSENFGYRKILWITRGYNYSALKIFCLTVPKKIVGESFCVSKKFWYRKFSCIGERGRITVLLKKVLSHRTETKNLVTEPCCFPENFWYRKNFMGKRGGWGVITFFRQKSLSFSAEKIPKGSLVFQKCSGIWNFLDNKGNTISSNFFVSQYRKIS